MHTDSIPKLYKHFHIVNKTTQVYENYRNGSDICVKTEILLCGLHNRAWQNIKVSKKPPHFGMTTAEVVFQIPYQTGK